MEALNNSILLRYILLFSCGWITVLLINYFYGTIALFTAAGIFATGASQFCSEYKYSLQNWDAPLSIPIAGMIALWMQSAPEKPTPLPEATPENLK